MFLSSPNRNSSTAPTYNRPISPVPLVLAVLLMVACLPMGLVAQQLEVTNVTSSQRDDDSGLVDIRYRLSDSSGPVTVSVRVSPDAGATWQSVSSVTGDVGPGINNGTRSIVWNAGKDVPDILWPNARIEVTASPGGCDGDGEFTIMLPGGVPLVMVCIPAGSFVMGSPSDERSRLSREGPQTTVTLTQDFYMGKYQVTQAQWLAVMGSWPGTAPSSTYGVGPSHPAYYISWNDAQNFITALNAHISSSGQGPATMRLPTEAEWEYAARAGTTTRFYFGDSLSVGDDCEDDGVRSQYMWYCGNSGSQTHPVGQKLPNAFGLYDMHGNVWEWCQDWYTSSLPGGSVTNPTGPSTGSYRVIRGGGWYNFARLCRSADRHFTTPSNRSYGHCGFRLVSVR